ncbi:MAG: 3-deoxy-8-phosphooctulonate synthase [Planctomycetota bacterium]
MSPNAAAMQAFLAQPSRQILVIGGPCVLEGPEVDMEIGHTLRDACRDAGLAYCFKASFDKANRSSGASHRGPGLQAGLDRIREIGQALGVPVTTDVHLPEQCAAAAAAVDLLQVPAFLCRQTDLLAAAATTGRPVNVKKGQFMSPIEMRQVIAKLRAAGCARPMVTERGTTFGYNRLVNDFIGIGDLLEMDCPVCFDATHSTQLPGAEGDRSGGRPERAPLLARAAVAAGVHAIFLECHPDPARARSDASTMLALDTVPSLLHSLARIRQAVAERSIATA